MFSSKKYYAFYTIRFSPDSRNLLKNTALDSRKRIFIQLHLVEYKITPKYIYVICQLGSEKLWEKLSEKLWPRFWKCYPRAQAQGRIFKTEVNNLFIFSSLSNDFVYSRDKDLTQELKSITVTVVRDRKIRTALRTSVGSRRNCGNGCNWCALIWWKNASNFKTSRVSGNFTLLLTTFCSGLDSVFRNLLRTSHKLTGDEYGAQARVLLGFQAVQSTSITASCKQIVTYVPYYNWQDTCWCKFGWSPHYFSKLQWCNNENCTQTKQKEVLPFFWRKIWHSNKKNQC